MLCQVFKEWHSLLGSFIHIVIQRLGESLLYKTGQIRRGYTQTMIYACDVVCWLLRNKGSDVSMKVVVHLVKNGAVQLGFY